MSFSDRFVSFHGTIKRIKTETYKRVSKHKYKIQTWRHTRHVILELVTIHFIKSKNESKIIFTATIIAMLLLSVGCNKELIGIEFGQEFQLAYNQKATITDPVTGESIKIKFDEFIVDSRCPEGVQCVWEGAVTIELLINNSQKVQVTHSTGPMNDTIGISDNGNYRVTMIDVDPYPIWNITTDKRDYVATLKIMK